MTSIEAYKRFENKINSLANGDNAEISPGEFVLIFNEQQVKWYQDKFRNRSSRFSIDKVQAFINKDATLTLSSENTRDSEYTLPSNYIDYIRSYVVASKGACKGRILKTYEPLNNDIEYILGDVNNNPSFEYAETPITIGGNKLQVYKTDFSIDSVFLTYYRYPINIDISGYTKIDGSASTNVNPELDDTNTNEIIDWCVKEVHRTFENPGGLQLSNDRINE